MFVINPAIIAKNMPSTAANNCTAFGGNFLVLAGFGCAPKPATSDPGPSVP
jgi:hypothetical protein